MSRVHPSGAALGVERVPRGALLLEGRLVGRATLDPRVLNHLPARA